MTMQARWFGRPSISTRQSWQTPMPQNRPRGRPLTLVVRQERIPVACRAAPIVWPGSTGIGRGVAVPHTKHPSIDKLIGTVAISEGGVNFDSLDGEKVHLLFLLVSPPDRPGDHLRALENISRQLRDDTFCRFLKQSKKPEDVWQLLEEADNNKFSH